MKGFFREYRKVILIAAVIFIVCTTVFSAFNTAADFAYAADAPYIVIGEEVFLLDSETGRKLFLLPPTYYAVIDNMDEEFYYVTFNGVSGKVSKESVSVVGYHTVAPGTVQEIKIDSKYSVFTEIKLKETMEGKGEEYPVPTGESMFFLGKYPSEEMWYYVKYNDKCGYLKAEYTTAPDISTGVFVPEEKEKPAEAPTPPASSDSGNLTKILVITGVCVAVVAVIVIIFLPKKKGGNKYYYEDTDL